MSPPRLGALLVLVVASCASVASPTPSPMAAPVLAPRQELADSMIRQVNRVRGNRELDDEAWDGVETATSIGLDCTQGYGSKWLFPEGGFHYSDESGSTTDANGNRIHADLDLFEFSVGVLAQWPKGSSSYLRPYAGAGGSMVHIDADIADNGLRGEDDDVFGFYWKAGVLVAVSLESHMGLEIRGFEGGSVTTELAEADADSVQLSLVLGASF